MKIRLDYHLSPLSLPLLLSLDNLTFSCHGHLTTGSTPTPHNFLRPRPGKPFSFLLVLQFHDFLFFMIFVHFLKKKFYIFFLESGFCLENKKISEIAKKKKNLTKTSLSRTKKRETHKKHINNPQGYRECWRNSTGGGQLNFG